MNRTLWTLSFVILASCSTTESHTVQNAEAKRDTLAKRLVGTWTREHEMVQYFPDGTYEDQERHQKHPTAGRWRLEGNSVVHIESGEIWTNKILSITKTELKMTFGNGVKGLEYERVNE